MFESEDDCHIMSEGDGLGFDDIRDSDVLGLKIFILQYIYLKGTLDLETRDSIGMTLTINIPE